LGWEIYYTAKCGKGKGVFNLWGNSDLLSIWKGKIDPRNSAADLAADGFGNGEVGVKRKGKNSGGKGSTFEQETGEISQKVERDPGALVESCQETLADHESQREEKKRNQQNRPYGSNSYWEKPN